jgi:hypothetical protein
MKHNSLVFQLVSPRVSSGCNKLGRSFYVLFSYDPSDVL